jgi:hypothetical protein
MKPFSSTHQDPMRPFYLYLKVHDVTGLKYLGQTQKDPVTYCGSGVYWKAHLSKHGSEHSTKILRECQTKEELKEWGLYYSQLWNIVESDEWANLKEEQGDGGRQSEEVRMRISQAGKGRTPWNKGKQIWVESQRAKIGQRNRARGPQSSETIAKRVSKTLGRKRTQETKDRIGSSKKGIPLSQSHKDKLKGPRPNSKVWNQGLKLPSSAAAKKWIVTNLDTGEQQEIISLQRWCEQLQISYQTMYSYLKKNKPYKNYWIVKSASS